jgi:hypothetical protein
MGSVRSISQRIKNQSYVSEQLSLYSFLMFYIVLCEPPTLADYENGLKKQQHIMELDMETWRVRCSDINLLCCLTDCSLCFFHLASHQALQHHRANNTATSGAGCQLQAHSADKQVVRLRRIAAFRGSTISDTIKSCTLCIILYTLTGHLYST